MSHRNLILVFSFITWIGCSGPPADEGAGPAAEEEYKAPVRVLAVAPQDMAETVSATGVITSDGAVAVSARVGGTVAVTPVDMGDRVDEGTILVRLDDRDYRIARDASRAMTAKARVAHEQAERDWERFATLAEEEVITESEREGVELRLELAAADLASARAGEEMAELDHARTRVRAPVDGSVAVVLVEVGQTLAPGTPVAYLERLDHLEVEVGLAESEIGRIRSDTPVRLEVPSVGSTGLEGTVKSVGVSPDPALGVYPVVISLPAETDSIRPGMTVRAAFQVARYPDTLAVPRDAVLERRGQTGVFVVEAGRALFRPVEPGIAAEGLIQVMDGLASGDRIVVLGQANLEDGQAVSPGLQES